MPEPIISINNICKDYTISHQASYGTLRDSITNLATRFFRRTGKASEERFHALKNISFDVQPGERIGIIGRNGAGKSTLLKILSQITPPSTGTIKLRGRVASLLEVGTGFHPELTGRENIYLNGAILGMKQSEIRKKFDEIVEFSEISKFLDTPVKRYSSGMYVRLAFSVAAHLDSDILIVDEVLAVGDMQFQKKCLGKMNEVTNAGKTIIFVSHSMQAIKALCSKAIYLENGQSKYQGDVLAAISKYSGRDASIKSKKVWATSNPKLGSITINEVFLRQNNQDANTELSSESPIEVVIKFSITDDNTKAGTTIIVTSQDGTIIFVSVSNHEPNWHAKIREKGNYKSTCTIPANIFAEGEYIISAVIWEGHYVSSITIPNIIRFIVHEQGLVRGDLPYEIKDGVIRPLLPWISIKE